MVGSRAKNFISPAVMPDNSIVEEFDLFEYSFGKNIVLFFYPLNFTFVCPSEIIDLDKKYNKFEERDTIVVLISVDSQYSSLAYKNTEIKDGGIGKIKIPMISDISKKISSEYGVLFNNEVALRGTFIINRTRDVIHQSINYFPIGRNIDEILRIIDAIKFNEEYGEVCPANWSAGKSGMKATSEGVKEYLKQINIKNSN